MIRPVDNRLNRAASPYLLQHAGNPVDWYEWGEAAFERARSNDSLVFLSIGYSTCHWCHVMAHESFEDDEVAAYLNEHFVSIKVDREERPDIDAVYMAACHMLSGTGGWPLTIVTTPLGQPVFAGTYLPKRSRFGRLGLLELLERLVHLWRTERATVVGGAASLTRVLQEAGSGDAAEGTPRDEDFDIAFRAFSKRYDDEHGGFGTAPKFPTPHVFSFLLRHWRRTEQATALAMMDHSLVAMTRGGLWDQVGYGYHRYSTDAQWLLPHFEKMLYDQALMALAHLEAYQATDKAVHGEQARNIFRYVLRDLRDPGGAFWSAEDADSEGHEGAFYLWTADEFRRAVGEDFDRAAPLFGVTAEGNVRDEATGRPTGRNVLTKRCTSSDDDTVFERCRRRLEHVRTGRTRPGVDDKVLTDWNGLMVAALARGGVTLDDGVLLSAAREAADFVWRHLRRADGRLLHRYRRGQAGLTATLDDHAFLAWGVMELYAATLEEQWLDRAQDIVDRMVRHFWDVEHGGFFMTADDAEALVLRPKEATDGALPAGNSVALYVLLRLARLTGRTDYEERAAAGFRAIAEAVRRAPTAYAFLLCAAQMASSPDCEVVLAAGDDVAETTAFLAAMRRPFLPNLVVRLASRDEYPVIQGRTTAYVCRGRHCEPPVTDVATALRLVQAVDEERGSTDG